METKMEMKEMKSCLCGILGSPKCHTVGNSACGQLKVVFLEFDKSMNTYLGSA